MARVTGNFDYLESICTPDVRIKLVGDKEHIPYAGEYCGVHLVRQVLEQAHVDFSYHNMRPDHILVDGDEVAIRWTGTLRNRGTGASADFEGFTHLIFENDRIKEYFALVDTSAMNRLMDGE